MNASNKAAGTPAASTDMSQALQASLSPVLAIRRGRGRLGGSTFLDLLIQRSRQAGRRMKPLDGDLRSGGGGGVTHGVLLLGFRRPVDAELVGGGV